MKREHCESIIVENIETMFSLIIMMSTIFKRRLCGYGRIHMRKRGGVCKPDE